MHVAVHQPPGTRDVTEAVGRIREALGRAEREGIDLVLFPECYIGGYFPNDEAATRRAAYEIGTAAFRSLLHGIGTFDTTLVVGLAERRDARLFNTAIVMHRGELLGCYAKARPNEEFFEPDGEVEIFTAAGVPFGVNICNDANYPEVARGVADAGARGIVMPLNNLLRHEVAVLWRERHLANLVERAKETGCWVASADIVGRTPERVAHGCTAIVDGRGRLLTRVPEDEVGHVTYEVGT